MHANKRGGATAAQFEGFAGVRSKPDDLQLKTINGILQQANNGSVSSFKNSRAHIKKAIHIASLKSVIAPITDKSLLFWRTANHGKPSEHAQAEETLAGHTFFSLSQNYLKNPQNPKKTLNKENSMNLRYSGIFIIILFTSVTALASLRNYPSLFSDPPIKRANPSEYPKFEMIDRELRNLVIRQGDPKVKNSFCVLGFKFSNNRERTSIIWINEGNYYSWDGASEDAKNKSNTLSFSRYLNIKTPVEDNVTSLGTAGVYRSDTESIIKDCEQYGQKYLIHPFTPPPKNEDEE